MLKLIIANIYTTIFFFSAGIFLNHQIFKKQKINNLYTHGIYGGILLCFLGLALNFIIALDQNINTLILIFFTIYFAIHLYKYDYLKIYIKKIFFVSLVSIILITLANSNRPDAGLYHLPFIQILNEEKLIVGLANIHFRFGTNSIIQYLSALNFNYFFGIAAITVPLSVLVSFLILYFFQEFLIEKKNNKQSFKLLFLFFILIFILYSFNRYSNFGNDATASITFLLLIYIFLFQFDFKKIEINILLKLYILSVFLFTQKLFYIVALLLIFLIYIFDKDKKKYFINPKIHLPTLFLLIFLIKNFLVSGCILYPVKLTCLNVSWLDINTVSKEAISGNAWSKDWVNYKNVNSISKDEYIKNFIWIDTWLKNHAKIIFEKLLPLFILLIIFFIFNKGKRKKKFETINFNFIIALVLSLSGTIVWFLYFPIYRYGTGYIFSTILLIYVLLFNNFFYVKKFTISAMYYILILCFILAGLKNFNRIYKNYKPLYVDYPFPRIFSFNTSNKPEEINLDINKYYHDKNFLFYVSKSGICMYNLAPCTYYINDKVRMKNKYGYKLYYINN